MAFSSKRSKTILNWIAKHPDLIEFSDAYDYKTADGKPGPVYWVECDEWGEDYEGPYSHWLYLKPGWFALGDPGRHNIHEPTAKEVLEQLKWIEKCDCEECEQLIKSGEG